MNNDNDNDGNPVYWPQRLEATVNAAGFQAKIIQGIDCYAMLDGSFSCNIYYTKCVAANLNNVNYSLIA